jgi:hypothetical protein
LLIRLIPQSILLVLLGLSYARRNIYFHLDNRDLSFAHPYLFSKIILELCSSDFQGTEHRSSPTFILKGSPDPLAEPCSPHLYFW